MKKVGRPSTAPITDLRTYRRRFVTPIQLAEYAGIGRRTIYHHIEKGALPIVKIGGVIRIKRDEALRYVGEAATA